jgi:hypothetical protein
MVMAAIFRNEADSLLCDQSFGMNIMILSGYCVESLKSVKRGGGRNYCLR